MWVTLSMRHIRGSILRGKAVRVQSGQIGSVIGRLFLTCIPVRCKSGAATALRLAGMVSGGIREWWGPWDAGPVGRRAGVAASFK